MTSIGSRFAILTTCLAEPDHPERRRDVGDRQPTSREKFPLLQDPPSDDICYATQNRQLAIKQIAGHSDLVIVVGSANSSNSVRLVEVALEAGAKAAHRIDNATEIDPAWLVDVDSIGVTSGASVPDDLVREYSTIWLTKASLSTGRAAYGGIAGLRSAAGAPKRSSQRCHQRLIKLGSLRTHCQ